MKYVLSNGFPWNYEFVSAYFKRARCVEVFFFLAVAKNDRLVLVCVFVLCACFCVRNFVVIWLRMNVSVLLRFSPAFLRLLLLLEDYFCSRVVTFLLVLLPHCCCCHFGGVLTLMFCFGVFGGGLVHVPMLCLALGAFLCTFQSKRCVWILCLVALNSACYPETVLVLPVRLFFCFWGFVLCLPFWWWAIYVPPKLGELGFPCFNV